MMILDAFADFIEALAMQILTETTIALAVLGIIAAAILAKMDI